MALVTRAWFTGLVTPEDRPLRGAFGDQYLAGEFLPRGSACFVHTDGKAYLCDGGSAGTKFRGFAPLDTFADEPIRLMGIDKVLRYATGLTINNILYLSGLTATRPVLAVTCTTSTAPPGGDPGAQVGATLINVADLPGHIRSGEVVDFGGGATATLTAPASTGDRTLTVAALSDLVPYLATASYQDATAFKGQLDTATTTGDTTGVAQVCGIDRIRCVVAYK